MISPSPREPAAAINDDQARPLQPRHLLAVHAACALVRARYYLSHATALHLHGLGPSPGALYVTVSQAVALPRLPDLPPVRRVLYPPRRFFGAARLAVGAKAVWISDLERTLIDGLKHPRYSGGVPAVVRALAQRGPSLDIEYLVRQALRLDIDTVKRRLGYLLELTGLLALAPAAVQQLEPRRDVGFDRLDPAGRGAGLRHPRWRLVVNLDPEALARDAVYCGGRRSRTRPPG